MFVRVAFSHGLHFCHCALVIDDCFVLSYSCHGHVHANVNVHVQLHSPVVCLYAYVSEIRSILMYCVFVEAVKCNFCLNCSYSTCIF